MSTTETAEKKMTLEHARQLANEYMREHGCRWSEACLAIKRKHPEARALFGAPADEGLQKDR